MTSNLILDLIPGFWLASILLWGVTWFFKPGIWRSVMDPKTRVAGALMVVCILADPLAILASRVSRFEAFGVARLGCLGSIPFLLWIWARLVVALARTSRPVESGVGPTPRDHA